MASMFRGVALVALVLAPTPAAAEGNCTTVELQFLPAVQAGNPFAPQIVAWLERPDGTFVETIFITQQTGTFGIGNRPGRYDFNSGPAWPYGRRVTVFPVWAHKHGLSWDALVFQNDDDSNLSHPFNESSREMHFCRPLQPEEPQFDAMTCASQAFTDKGAPGTGTSKYPPRNDLQRETPDHPSVELYAMLNPFDSVSQATPPAGTLATVSYAVPETLPAGDYVLMLEVSREFDMNGTYNPQTFPPPAQIPWSDYGEPYRGQPSVLYRVPFTLASDGERTAIAVDYVGYGDPDGLDGNVRVPDSTITTDVAGSGAARLQLVSRDGETYRVRVVARPQEDLAAPGIPADVQVLDASANRATISFIAPGDDGTTGRARRYEIRYLASGEITPETFDTGTLVSTVVVPANAGGTQTFALEDLLAETEYSVGIRAVDDCSNVGELAVLNFITEPRDAGQVDACFIATAAYGSTMANDVGMLRRFRDVMLKQSPLGELAVETYYTFSPALSGVVGESDLLRATARDLLSPVISRVRGLRVEP